MSSLEMQLIAYQAVQLWNWALWTWLTDVPHFDAAFTTSIHVFGWVWDGYGTNHLSVAEGVDLASVSWYSWPYKGIRRKGHRLHLSIGVHKEGVRPKSMKSDLYNSLRWS